MQREMILGTRMASMSLLQLSKRLADLLERFIISTVIWLQDIIDLPCILSALSECCRFALPGTEKKTPTQVTSAMKSHAEQSWSAIAEPTTAVLLHLKSKADNNSAPASYANSSAPSDHTKSTQPSHAKSTGPPDKSAQVHVKPPVANVPKLLNQLISRTTSAAQPLWPLMTLDSMIFTQLHLLHQAKLGIRKLGRLTTLYCPKSVWKLADGNQSMRGQGPTTFETKNL